MLILVLDANAVHRDPWLTRDDAKKLVQLAASGACEIVYPRVVIRELTRQRVDIAREAHDSAAESVKQMGVAGVTVTQTANLLQGAYDRMRSDIDDAFEAVLAKGGIRDVPIPEVKTSDLVDRDLGRRRPFLEIDQGKTKKSLGFRDVLIWESVLGLLQASSPDATVLFVTFDGGFIAEDKASLHADLLEDLDQLGIPRKRIRLARGVPEAISLVDDLSADVIAGATSEEPRDEVQSEESAPALESPAPDEKGVPAPQSAETSSSNSLVGIAVGELEQTRPVVSHAALVKAATDALYGLVDKDVSERLLNGGDYGYPPFAKFTVPALDGATIAGIDQTTEFSFEGSPKSPDILEGTAEAIITLEGALYRGDWFIAVGAVTVTGDQNRHYLDASAEVEVKVVIEIDIAGGETNVVEVVLEDVPTPPA